MNQQYGFAKVRRGPDTDMYAHPSFIRGHQEAVAQLRKGGGSSSSSRSRSRSPSAQAQQTTSKLTSSPATVSIASSRSNSFSSTISSSATSAVEQLSFHQVANAEGPFCSASRSRSNKVFEPVSPYPSYTRHTFVAQQQSSSTSTKACNKLALLTLALSSLADAPCP